MKSFSKKVFSLCLAALFAAVFALPCFAGGVTDESISGHDVEKLLAFWHQPAYDGLNNGEAVYDHDWPAANYYCGDPSGSYDDTWSTRLVSYDETYDRLSVSFSYYESFWSYDEDPEYGPIYGYGFEYVYPDLYGALELEGTAMYSLDSPREGQTHITSVDLDGCTKLRTVRFNGQEYCKSISALGMYQLEQFYALNCAYEHIAFSPSDIDGNMAIDSLGFGTVGAEYDCSNGNTVKAYANPKSGKFVGWYIDGQLVSTELEYTCSEGCELTAYFGGDANSDGTIDATDALLMLRIALGVAHIEGDTAALDVNSNGAVDANDALMVFRFLLGLMNA